MRFASVLVVAAALTAAPAMAEGKCKFDARVVAAAAAWRMPAPQPPLVIDPADALCFRNALLRRIAPLGPVVGYKVGAYSRAARAPLGATEPVVGILHRKMVLEEGATVSARYAVAPVVEADFLLVVKDAGINGAKTRAEIYKHLRGYKPFIELPDNNNGPEVKPTLGRLIALNVNARLSVEGREVALPQTAEGMEALTNLSVKVAIRTPKGIREQSGKMSETLGDPLEIAMAARDLLLREGRRLKAGDVISLGAIVPPFPAEAGETFQVHYELAGGLSSGISLTFTP